MATNTVNMNVQDVNNVEMVMTDDTASPHVDKTVGSSTEIDKEQGQEIEIREYSEKEIQNVGPESQEVEQTDNVNKSVGPGERERERSRKRVRKGESGAWENGARSFTFNYVDVDRPRAKY